MGTNIPTKILMQAQDAHCCKLEVNIVNSRHKNQFTHIHCLQVRLTGTSSLCAVDK